MKTRMKNKYKWICEKVPEQNQAQLRHQQDEWLFPWQ